MARESVNVQQARALLDKAAVSLMAEHAPAPVVYAAAATLAEAAAMLVGLRGGMTSDEVRHAIQTDPILHQVYTLGRIDGRREGGT